MNHFDFINSVEGRYCLRADRIRVEDGFSRETALTFWLMWSKEKRYSHMKIRLTVTLHIQLWMRTLTRKCSHNLPLCEIMFISPHNHHRNWKWWNNHYGNYQYLKEILITGKIELEFYRIYEFVRINVDT